MHLTACDSQQLFLLKGAFHQTRKAKNKFEEMKVSMVFMLVIILKIGFWVIYYWPYLALQSTLQDYLPCHRMGKNHHLEE